MMRLAFCVLLLVGTLPQIGVAVTAEAGERETITARVDKIFAKWDTTRSPGCALAVIQDGRIVYKRGYGMASLDHDVPITPSTVFNIASVSKQFTAAAIVLLAQQGKLSLDDEVRKYIPELPDFGTPITIRHLIHHTSGLRIFWPDGALHVDDLLELVSRLQGLNFPPGENYLYSNVGYMLLGLIVERVSGESLRAFTRAEIFEPLGMKNTHFRDDHGEIVKHQAQGYEPANGDAFRRSIIQHEIPGASLVLTTVEDLALWDRNFYDKRVGGSALIEQLHQRGRLNNGEQLEYAFGLVISEYRGLPIAAHSGWHGGYRAHLMRFPEQRFSVACLCNAGNAGMTLPYLLARKVADIYLAKELKKPASAAAAEETVQVTERQLASKVGLYWNREWRGMRKIFLKEGKLHLIDPADSSDESYKMEPLSETRFRLVRARIVEYRFERAEPGGRLRLVRSVSGSEPQFFELVAPFTATRTEMGEYVGTYLGDEVDLIYRVALENDKLVLKRLGVKPATLEPVTRGLFKAPEWFLKFTRDANNRVSGVVFNSYRNRNYRFTKQTP